MNEISVVHQDLVGGARLLHGAQESCPLLLRLQVLVTRPTLMLSKVELVDSALHLHRLDARDHVPTEAERRRPRLGASSLPFGSKADCLAAAQSEDPAGLAVRR